VRKEGLFLREWASLIVRKKKGENLHHLYGRKKVHNSFFREISPIRKDLVFERGGKEEIDPTSSPVRL